MKKYIMLLLIIIFALTGCKEKVYEIDNTNDIKIINSEIDVYSDIFVKDIIMQDSNIELISDNYQIDTSELGDKEYKLLYKKDNKKYEYKFNVKIVDKEAPIIFSGTSKTITKGYDGDVCNVITFGDNYDGNLNCEIIGDYNVNKVGTYYLKYKISDNSNNIKEVNVTLNVIEKSNSSGGSSSSNTKRTNFIDVSKWQGNIDFKKVKDAGATFVMMRIGVQKTRGGDLEIDPYFEQNFKNAKDAGLKIGVYLYSIATSSEEAISHANWVIKTLNNEAIDLPIVFDWENWSRWNSYKLSFHEINNIANNFMTTVKNNGYEGMLYSSKFYLETIWTNKLEFPVWLAHYTSKTSYQGKYIMWQMCNDGKIDGINGAVDIDILYH